MRETVRLGGGAGFAGDRLDAPIHLAEHGALDYLIKTQTTPAHLSRSLETWLKD